MPATIDEIVGEIQNLHYEISNESRLVRVGLKDEQNLEAIIARFPRLTHRETVAEIRERMLKAAGAEDKERLTRIYLYCLGHYIHKTLARLDDEVTTFFSKATVQVNGESIPYHNLYPCIMKEENFDQREKLGGGFGRIHEKVNPMLLEILEKEVSILIGEFGYTGYIDYCRDKKKLDYESRARELTASLARTQGLYEKAMGLYVEQALAKPFKRLWRIHIPYLLKMKAFDTYFPKDGLFDRLNDSLLKMGIDFKHYPNIHLDLEERPKKNPRACCFTSRVPHEIHLILKPVGGLKDYETFLHEGGHALHYGSTDPGLPYEYRELSRSYALSETYAFLLQNLTMNVRWLSEEQGVPEAVSRAIRRERVLIDLFMYRRYVGKFLAELEFFRDANYRDDSIYARSLQHTTGFYYEPSAYLTDLDGEFYSMDYLRAWIAEAELEDYMKRSFGELWFRNLEAGQFLVSLWKSGEREDPEAVLARLGYRPFDVSYLEKRFEELL